MSLIKGDDKVIQFTLTNEDESPVVINALIGVIIWLYQGTTVLAKYSIHTLSGYEDINVVDSANGVISINLKRSKLQAGTLQNIFAEIKISEPSADFDNNEALTTVINVNIDLLQDSLTKDVLKFV